MRRIIGNVYRINELDTGRVHFAECVDDEDAIRYYVQYMHPSPVNMVRISHSGSTPKVAIYTNPYYKQLIKEREKKRKAEEKRRNTPPTDNAINLAKKLRAIIWGADFIKAWELIEISEPKIEVDEIEFTIRTSKPLNSDHMSWYVADPISEFLEKQLGVRVSVGYGDKGWLGGTVYTNTPAREEV